MQPIFRAWYLRHIGKRDECKVVSIMKSGAAIYVLKCQRDVSGDVESLANSDRKQIVMQVFGRQPFQKKLRSDVCLDVDNWSM